MTRLPIINMMLNSILAINGHLINFSRQVFKYLFSTVCHAKN